MNGRGTAKMVSLCALFAVFAMAISYLERLIPPLSAAPGVKPGLANIAVLAALYLFGMRYALLINLTRILLTGLLFGDLNSLFYSLCGGLLSFGMMCLLLRLRCFGVVGVSAAGGVFHNIGQLAAATVTLGSGAVWGYFPVLLLSGTATGILTGVIAHLLVRKLQGVLKWLPPGS